MSDATEWTGQFGTVSQEAPKWPTKRPLRIALMGDFSGGALRGRLDTGATLAKRKPLKVEFDTLDDALGRLNLNVRLPMGDEDTPVEIELGELEAFHPDELYRNVEMFSALASLRKRLNNTSTFAAAAKEVQSWGGGSAAKVSRSARRSKARGGAPTAGARLDDFARLTGRPSTAAQAEATVDDLLKRVVGPWVVPAANPQKDALLATVDGALSDAMRAILHHGDFQNLESLWRGADFLLRRLETSHQLQVHLIDISAEELAADLSKVEDLSESGLYQMLVGNPSQEPDGGYTYLAGLYHFEATPPHAELLGRMALVASHAGAPFITGMDFEVFSNRKEPPHRLIREAFEALRSLPAASFLGLIGPRFLLRHPYGKKSDPISSFNLEEFTAQGGLRGMLWGHPALLAVSILARGGSALAVDDLPFHYMVDGDGDTIALPCTDRLVNTNGASLLRTFGLNAVMAHKGEPVVRLAGLEAVNGDGLAAPDSGGPRKPASEGRFVLGGKGGSTAGATTVASVAMRKGSAAAASSSEDDSASEGEEATADMDAGSDSSGSDDAGGMDDELDALLKSLEEPGDSSAGGDGSSGDDAATEAAAEPEMDPELAALLASLE